MGHAILERVLLFGTRSADYIRASGHNDCIATEVILQATTEAEYMTASERFADSQIPLAPRAPSIHDPQRNWSVHRSSPGLLRDHLSIASSARASTDGGMARPAISGRSAINDEMAQFDFCGAPFGVQ